MMEQILRATARLLKTSIFTEKIKVDSTSLDKYATGFWQIIIPISELILKECEKLEQENPCVTLDFIGYLSVYACRQIFRWHCRRPMVRVYQFYLPSFYNYWHICEVCFYISNTKSSGGGD